MTFEGVLPVLHVPFADTLEQAILEHELAALAERMLALGVDGLAVPQLASEAWALTESERDRVVAIAAEACAGRAPLVVGIDGATAVAVDRARRAADAGAAGLMVLPPRGGADADELVAHYVAVADAAGLPLMVQDSPQVTGVQLEVSLLARMRRAHPLVVAVKSEIPGAGPKASAVGEAGLRLVAGWGGLHYLELVARGAVGCLPGCDLAPALKAIDTAVRSGRDDEARTRYRQVLPYLSLASSSLELLLLTAKRHLRRSGIFSTELLRAPARTLDAHEARAVDALLDELKQAGVPGF